MKSSRCVFSSPFQGTAANKVQLATAHSQLYRNRSYKVSPTLYQSDLRIFNHRGQISTVANASFIQNSNRMTSSVDCNCKFSELTFSTPAISKATSKLFSSIFSTIFFKICRFRSSILLSL